MSKGPTELVVSKEFDQVTMAMVKRGDSSTPSKAVKPLPFTILYQDTPVVVNESI